LYAEGKILEKLRSKRIKQHLYKTEYLKGYQYGFTYQKNTVDAAIEVKQYIELHLEKGGVAILGRLDLRGALIRHGGRRNYRGCVTQNAPENFNT